MNNLDRKLSDAEVEILRVYYEADKEGLPLVDNPFPRYPLMIADMPLYAFGFLNEAGYLEGGTPEGSAGGIKIEDARITEKGREYIRALFNE